MQQAQFDTLEHERRTPTRRYAGIGNDEQAVMTGLEKDGIRLSVHYLDGYLRYQPAWQDLHGETHQIVLPFLAWLNEVNNAQESCVGTLDMAEACIEYDLDLQPYSTQDRWKTTEYNINRRPIGRW